METGLSIRGLRVPLGGFVLGELSLELAVGDYYVLMGPSGCGKTSLLKTIAGLHRTHDGVIEVAGQCVNGLPPQKRRIGYVSQADSLFPHLTVRENICFGLAYARFSREEQERRFDDVVKKVGVGGLLHRHPADLSGGEIRRVALARSLILEPAVLLLDEPLSMLDTRSRLELLEVLRSLHDAANMVTLHVTHQCEEALVLRAHCGVMRDGKLVQSGTLEELWEKPADEFVADFLRLCPFDRRNCPEMKRNPERK